MAFGSSQIYTLVGVLLVLFAVIVFNNVSAARARMKARGAKPDESTGAVHPMLVKFARYDGSVVGETVALDGDMLVLKQAGLFKSVPVRQAEVRGDEVFLSGPIDWTAAEQAGQAWHAARRTSDLGVSGALTTSADVKAPAMESVRARDGKS